LSKNDAIEIARIFLHQACRKHSIRSAWLFGSYARGTQREYSDIDLALVLPTAVDKHGYLQESFDIFHEAQEFNSLLEIVCFRENEFNNEGPAIINRIKKDGLKIDLA